MSKITIISVSNEFVAKAKGGYNALTVNFTDERGKTTARKIFDFAAREVYAALKNATPGQVYEVSEQKNQKGYDEFTSATATTEKVAVPAAGSAVPKSNYETADERAARQKLIVRQSSVSSAISLLVLQGDKKSTVNDVVQVAKQLEDFVYDRVDAKNASKTVAAARNDDFPDDDVPQ